MVEARHMSCGQIWGVNIHHQQVQNSVFLLSHLVPLAAGVQHPSRAMKGKVPGHRWSVEVWPSFVVVGLEGLPSSSVCWLLESD